MDKIKSTDSIALLGLMITIILAGYQFILKGTDILLGLRPDLSYFIFYVLITLGLAFFVIAGMMINKIRPILSA